MPMGGLWGRIRQFMAGRRGADGPSLFPVSYTHLDVYKRQLLVCAGGHARREMAGPGPDSWLSRLRGMGLAVRPLHQGLAELPALRALYCRHLAEALAAAGLDSV